jgi:exonuclease SbcC
MWKLKKIEAENLCAFRSLSYTLRQGVTTLIFGDNRDNESQRSNGAGKSALLECIAVGITGSPLRKIRSEEIINDASGECRIGLHFSNSNSTEELVVNRCIPRKGASTVSCTLFRNGAQVTTDEAVQPSVDAYNRYILEKLGITREELLNNFILSKYRYEDFLSSSDKEKKEIINRFSNGILVDEAIAILEEDIVPLSEKKQQAALELAGLDGRVEMLQEQIRKEEETGAERGRTRAERIASLEAAIAAKREQIRIGHETVAGYETRLVAVQQADEALQLLESGDTALDECLEKIREMMPLFPDARQTDWNGIITGTKEKLQTAVSGLSDCDTSLKQAERELEEETENWEQFKNKYAAFCEEYNEQSGTAAEKLRETDIRLRNLAGCIEELRHKRRIVSAGIDELSNKLAGSVTCPACGHNFLIAEPQFDIEAGMRELKLRQRQLTEINGRIEDKQEETGSVELQQSCLNHGRRTLEARRTEWEQQLAGYERAVRNATRNVEATENKHRRIAAGITALQNEIESIRRKVFDETFGFVDERNASLSRSIRTEKEDIQAAACAIDILQGTIRELNEAVPSDLISTLRSTLREVREKSREAAGRKTAVDAELRTLEMQRERFIQFKTYLANTKIEALSRITNEFLQNIGSDIRIRFDGYTVLKSGKVREKISISLLRDGIDCGSFGKFSAGEAARVNLATILAMQKLVNSNCDDGKGLDLLVLDEILEAVDEAGLASMFEALNSLGGTVLVVSHGNVAEGYPHKLVIVKENGESRIGE